MKRSPRSRGLLALAAATVLVPLGAGAALAGQPSGPETAPAANYEGDTVSTGDAGAFFYNGEDATVSEFPGVVAAIRGGGSRPEGQSCTGIVVAPRKVLIAAHCKDLAGEKGFVYGLDDLADYDGGAGPGFYAKAVEYKQHPRYVNFDQGYDVAVVTVDRDIRLKGGADYPEFATSADAGIWQIGDTGLGFGYGKKTHNDSPADVTLDKATLPIVDGNRVCQGVGAGFKAATMICAGHSDGRVTVLPGDSGGPFIVDGKIVGLASWSRSDFRWYSIYSRLDNDMGDWVADEIGDVPDPEPGEFGVSVEPGSGSVAPNESLSVAVNTTEGDGGSEAVDLSTSGVPAGVEAFFQPEEISTGESAKLTFSANADATNGMYPITVTATTSGGQSASGRFELTVAGGGDPEPGDFRLGVSPATVRVAAGEHASTTITSTAGSGGAEEITLTASGVPEGVRTRFQPASITTGDNAKLTFDAGSTARDGTHTVTVTGTGPGGRTATTTVSLTVEGDGGGPDPGEVTVRLDPSSGSGWAGQLVSTRATVSGGTGNLTLSASGAPAGTQVMFHPPTVPQGGTSMVWMFTNFQTPPGTYPITITATSADGESGTARFSLTVTRFGFSTGGIAPRAW